MTDALFGDANKLDVLYFGAYKELGHYLYNNKGQRITSPYGPRLSLLDGQLLSECVFTQGKATYVYLLGWTVISFWDRTGDSRYGSNSAFLVDEKVPFDVLLDAAKVQYPQLFSRFTFPIVLND